ncbi:MAG: TetR/AcrR family transcriptional regulator [Thermodesulfobacteriota bacterium]|nr:TetR/AcrR family transcriptional regulator [Thermodesulfobacteriota bacterium]
MAGRKVVPLRDKEMVKERIIRALGRVLARDGYQALDVDAVAGEACASRKLIFKHFGGLEGLVRAYGRTPEFWPSAEELLGPDHDRKGMSLAAQIGDIYKSYLAALRQRPLTLDILAWESKERTHLTRILEGIRVRRSLEVFERIQGDFPDDIDMSAVVALMASAVISIAVRSRTCGSFGGIDLESDAGWNRLEEAIDALLTRAIVTP